MEANPTGIRQRCCLFISTSPPVLAPRIHAGEAVRLQRGRKTRLVFLRFYPLEHHTIHLIPGSHVLVSFSKRYILMLACVLPLF